MKSNIIRKTFLEYFKSKSHHIVPSAPMVVKNDPTLMFINAGMNQFKDIFLGNTPISNPRITDTQKCLRVSGKHNDLDEVGHDTYHHTMFEMLGNWSFGDYFKKEAIEWAWELLTEVYKIDKNFLYVTVFGGDESDGLEKDTEAYQIWKTIVPEDRILFGNKKDNFWEMGDSGPCGPCSEIHIDIRDKNEKIKVDGATLVNTDHPLVIEIWNLVFIEFNRKANGHLEQLPKKHIDTGLGFERLCMVIQGHKSNYDTDVFQPIIQEVATLAGKKYGENEKEDIAMRVIADHLRAVAFAITDGQLPSNNKAGYVIRRILRRAIRYGYTFLGFKEPFINELLPFLVSNMQDVFPEIKKQQDLIRKVILEEETAFLRTLSLGIQKFEKYISSHKEIDEIEGSFAFELFDTYGFPIDLTQLMAREQGLRVDMSGFVKNLEVQKNRSRKAASQDTGDWIILKDVIESSEFIGYDSIKSEIEIIKYRKVKAKNSEFFELVFDKTPFYAESGGQVGDIGYIEKEGEKIFIENTKKENDLTIHIAKAIINDLNGKFIAAVNEKARILTSNNHSATHLLHAALREVLGLHIEQKGSLVDNNKLRFDFAHFSKLTREEIRKVEKIVNKKIRDNIPIIENRNIKIEDAKKMGAIALFGEKYGEYVRTIAFDTNFSIELCGGTHVNNTGQIGIFKIISESAIAAGIRRIEAITANKAEDYFNAQDEIISQLKDILKNPNDIAKSVKGLNEERHELQKQIERLNKEKALSIKSDLINNKENIHGIEFIGKYLDVDLAVLKDISFNIIRDSENIVLVVGTNNKGKAFISVAMSENLIKNQGLNAGNLVREISKEIQGGGGGQAHYASAGGKNPNGIHKAIEKAKEIISKA
ncbi:MAG: alanine--tRNA ligase [Bacteroidales bacterium]|nr:alanine--tRNA ligase [Bacteroidales bacterium]